MPCDGSALTAEMKNVLFDHIISAPLYPCIQAYKGVDREILGHMSVL